MAGLRRAGTRCPPLLPPRPQPDYAEELQKLAELKAAGVINDEEFEAKKKQILGL